MAVGRCGVLGVYAEAVVDWENRTDTELVRIRGQ